MPGVRCNAPFRASLSKCWTASKCICAWHRPPKRAYSLMLAHTHGFNSNSYMSRALTSAPARKRIAPIVVSELVASIKFIRRRSCSKALLWYFKHSLLILASADASVSVNMTAFPSAGSSSPLRKTLAKLWNAEYEATLKTGSSACRAMPTYPLNSTWLSQ